MVALTYRNSDNERADKAQQERLLAQHPGQVDDLAACHPLRRLAGLAWLPSFRPLTESMFDVAAI